MPEQFQYSIGHDIVAKYEQELLASLSELYSDADQRMIVEKILIPQFRLSLEEVFQKFRSSKKYKEGVVIRPSDIPELCKEITNMIRRNRELLDIGGVFAPAYEVITKNRKSAQMELEQEQAQQFSGILAVHGVTDRKSLLAKGSRRFMKEDFHPYGKGSAFAGAILGRVITKVKVETLKEIATKLALPEIDGSKLDEEKQKQIDALAIHGITCRRSLLAKGVVSFMKEDFHPYGKGSAFVGAILGRSMIVLTTQILEEIATKLELPEIDESRLDEERQNQLQALAVHGVTDRKSLLAKGSIWFKVNDFPPYGKGFSFAGAILGRRITNVKTETLEEIADKLGFAELDANQKKQQQLQALAVHDITDRKSLLAKGPVWFMKNDFPPYGKGFSFAGAILGRRITNVKTETLEEIADKLGFAKLDKDQKKQDQLEALAVHGITDRKSLLAKGPTWFVKEDFPPYGGGSAFAGAILGRTIMYPAIKILEEIADVLFPDNKS